MLTKLTFTNTDPRFIVDNTDGAFILRPNMADEFWKDLEGFYSDTVVVAVVPDEEIGFYHTNSFNFEHYLDYTDYKLAGRHWEQGMDSKGNCQKAEFGMKKLPKNMFGVADNIEQIKRYFAAAINNPNVNLVVSVVELKKEDEPAQGGWRWHKWGEYIGICYPQCEYLHDEPAIEKVLVFHGYFIESR